jgi:glycosyltransferase involved in cell wall biosynthesis
MSVMGQTILPTRWIIVDDGSTDGTSEIADTYASRASWISVVHKPDRGYRVAGGGVVEAFYAGYALLRDEQWDFLVKLDGDVSFASDYFQRCFEIFAANARLGIGGGTVCRLDRGGLKIDSIGDPPFHVRGATKIYRRACWERISPLVMAPGWDTVDEVKANLYGWTTATFRGVAVVQHKRTGAVDGSWRDSYKNGRANYIAGYHPLFMLAKCMKRALHRPVLFQSLALLAGFCSGYLHAIPRAETEVIRYIRKQQLRRLLLQSSLYGPR